MRAADVGDRVRVHFTGKLVDGTVVESSGGDDPLEFTLGQREVISGLEELVRGMRSGEKRCGRIPPDRAHGSHRNDLMLAVERERFPSHVDPYMGQQLRMKREGQPEAIVRVVATTGDMVLLDTNHPLAGRELHVEVELVDILKTGSGIVC
ncbi:MAG: FKBP-type peptidyl-prolyl cis-trans isomerase [Gemmatimonadota bacterium]|jgi:peptidylprolyl isomerase|nr:FKBP-type peptidyl-prolyl cis-trans isomerase [Gemmatimonadota bacterium]